MHVYHAGETEVTDAELLAIGDQLWAADSEKFGSVDLTLDITGREGR